MKSLLVVALLVIFQVRSAPNQSSIPSHLPLPQAHPFPPPESWWWRRGALAVKKETQTQTHPLFLKPVAAPLHLLSDPTSYTWSPNVLDAA